MHEEKIDLITVGEMIKLDVINNSIEEYYSFTKKKILEKVEKVYNPITIYESVYAKI